MTITLQGDSIFSIAH